MPPKKKKEGGDGKKEKKSGKKSMNGPAAPEQLNEQSKEYYLAQIRDLESRIDRYQVKCDELEVKNNEFRQQFDQLEDNKKDIVNFIKKKLDEKVDEISDLSDRLVGLQQSKDQDRESFEQQLQQLRTEYRETKDQLTSENMMLSGKLASLEEFRIQREELMSQTAKLETMLVEQANAHQEDIYNLEKKQVIDKDKLKKEMITRVNQVAAEFRKASNRQMAETTKRTIRENVAVSSQIAKMSDKTMELITNNDDLKEKERHQRYEIELYQSMEEELTKKNISNQKIINMLLEKCRALEIALEESADVEDQHSTAEAEIAQLRQQLETARVEMTTLAKKNQQLEHQLSTAQSTLEDRVRARKGLEQVLENAAEALREVVLPASAETSESLADIVNKRASMLETLLGLLNSAADLGVGPSLAELRTGSDLDSSRWLKKRTLEDSTSRPLPPHYRPGDLGLVPRPDQALPSSSHGSHSVESLRRTLSTGALRTGTGKSASTQTTSPVQALFFSDTAPRRTPATSSAEFRRSVPNGKRLPAINSQVHSMKSVSGKVY